MNIYEMFEVIPLEKDVNSVVKIFAIRFTKPVSAQWLDIIIHDGLEESIKNKGKTYGETRRKK